MEEPQDDKPATLDYAKPEKQHPFALIRLGLWVSFCHLALVLALIGWAINDRAHEWIVEDYLGPPLVPLVYISRFILPPLAVFGVLFLNSLLYGFALAYLIRRIRRWRSRA